jgi:hypothetical protein
MSSCERVCLGLGLRVVASKDSEGLDGKDAVVRFVAALCRRIVC